MSYLQEQSFLKSWLQSNARHRLRLLKTLYREKNTLPDYARKKMVEDYSNCFFGWLNTENIKLSSEEAFSIAEKLSKISHGKGVSFLTEVSDKYLCRIDWNTPLAIDWVENSLKKSKLTYGLSEPIAETALGFQYTLNLRSMFNHEVLKRWAQDSREECRFLVLDVLYDDEQSVDAGADNWFELFNILAKDAHPKIRCECADLLLIKKGLFEKSEGLALFSSFLKDKNPMVRAAVLSVAQNVKDIFIKKMAFETVKENPYPKDVTQLFEPLDNLEMVMERAEWLQRLPKDKYLFAWLCAEQNGYVKTGDPTAYVSNLIQCFEKSQIPPFSFWSSAMVLCDMYNDPPKLVAKLVSPDFEDFFKQSATSPIFRNREGVLYEPSGDLSLRLAQLKSKHEAYVLRERFESSDTKKRPTL